MTPLDLAPSAPVDPAAPTLGAYARCIAASKRVRWDIDTDVIRGRRLSTLPTRSARRPQPDRPASTCLSTDDKRWLSQIQGRTYANMFGLVERFIGAKVLEISRDHSLGDQTAL